MAGRRRSSPPISPKPRIIISHVDGSGTGLSTPSEIRPPSCGIGCPDGLGGAVSPVVPSDGVPPFVDPSTPDPEAAAASLAAFEKAAGPAGFSTGKAAILRARLRDAAPPDRNTGFKRRAGRSRRANPVTASGSTRSFANGSGSCSSAADCARKPVRSASSGKSKARSLLGIIRMTKPIRANRSNGNSTCLPVPEDACAPFIVVIAPNSFTDATPARYVHVTLTNIMPVRGQSQSDFVRKNLRWLSRCPHLIRNGVSTITACPTGNYHDCIVPVYFALNGTTSGRKSRRSCCSTL